MAEHVLANGRLWLAELALAGKVNAVSCQYGAEVKDITTLSDLSRRRIGGLLSWGIQMNGNWDASDDAIIIGNLTGLTSVPVTVCYSGTVGDVAFLGEALHADYSTGEQIGEVMPFSGGAEGNGPLARGVLMQNAARTATGSSTAQQIGALSATQRMLVAVHVPIVSGTLPTLDVTVESDDNSGFTSATTRATLSQMTAAGWRFSTISGAVTDDYWRLKFTIGGTSPSFTIAAAMGRI